MALKFDPHKKKHDDKNKSSEKNSDTLDMKQRIRTARVWRSIDERRHPKRVKSYDKIEQLSKSTLHSISRENDSTVAIFQRSLDLERTNYHSQLKFLDRIIKENKDKVVFFKLHPHSLVLGLSLVNHIKLFFKNCFITYKTPSELDKTNDSVHTLGSKYGLQSARNNINTYIYGYTFFSDLINKNKLNNLNNLNKLKLDKNIEDIINKYRLDIDLYENDGNSIKTSANTIIQISSAICNKNI